MRNGTLVLAVRRYLLRTTDLSIRQILFAQVLPSGGLRLCRTN